jgi:ketosteroid isomerase-like protein
LIDQWNRRTPQTTKAALQHPPTVTVQSFWQSGFDRGVYDLVLESVEVTSLGDGVACEIGHSITRVRAADGSSIDLHGNSVCIFRREEDDAWRADVDIFNASGDADN